MLTKRDEGENPGHAVPPTLFVAAHPAHRRDHEVPESAFFQVWRKPIVKGVPYPTNAGMVFAKDAFSQERLLLVCFARTGPHEWGRMKFALRDAEDLRTPTFFVIGEKINSDTNAAFMHLNGLTQMHGLDGNLHRAPLAFVLDPSLVRFLGIGDEQGGIHDALVLIKHGKVVAKCVARNHNEKLSWREIRAEIWL